ncbi:MAG: aquaporin [Coriobacteriia bacterium]|nr:aquaporin [Coriobacteriia bacterium]
MIAIADAVRQIISAGEGRIVVEKKILRSELIAEYLGSMFLVMAAIASMTLFTSVFDSPKSIAVIANALAVALVLIALIEVFGSVSGAHFNPVVTLAMMLEKKIGTAKAAWYVLFQIAGGLTGTALSNLMFLDEVGSLFSISQIPRTDYVYFGEIFGTFILVLAILLLVKAGSSILPLAVGFLVGGQLLATSSTMFANPQVTIARMFTNSAAGIRPIDGLVFIAMQVIGALLAYVVYRYLFSNTEAKNEKGSK